MVYISDDVYYSACYDQPLDSDLASYLNGDCKDMESDGLEYKACVCDTDHCNAGDRGENGGGTTTVYTPLVLVLGVLVTLKHIDPY